MRISKSVCIVEQQWIKVQFSLRNNPLSPNRNEDALINVVVLPLKFFSIVIKYLFINIYYYFYFICFGGGLSKGLPASEALKQMEIILLFIVNETK